MIYVTINGTFEGYGLNWMDWWDGRNLYLKTDERVTTEIDSRVRGLHDKMRCGAQNSTKLPNW